MALSSEMSVGRTWSLCKYGWAWENTSITIMNIINSNTFINNIIIIIAIINNNIILLLNFINHVL